MNKFLFINNKQKENKKICRKKDDKVIVTLRLPETEQLDQENKVNRLIEDLNKRQEYLKAIIEEVEKHTGMNFLKRISINVHTHAIFRLIFGKEVGYTPPKQPHVGSLLNRELYVDNSLGDFMVKLEFIKPDTKNKARFITNE